MYASLTMRYCLYHPSFTRDLRESRQRYDSVGNEIKRKDNQIRELQQRLESNEGCKFTIFFTFLFFHQLNSIVPI